MRVGISADDHPTAFEEPQLTRPFFDDLDGHQVVIQHSKVVDHNGQVAALFAAIEVLTWQLVTSGILPAEPLAAELTRHAHFHPDGERVLRLLGRVARAAAPSQTDP